MVLCYRCSNGIKMNPSDLQWVAAGLSLSGLCGIGMKAAWGPPLAALASSSWCLYASLTGQFPMAATEAVYAICYGITAVVWMVKE